MPDTDVQAVRRGKLTGTEKSRETNKGNPNVPGHEISGIGRGDWSELLD